VPASLTRFGKTAQDSNIDTTDMFLWTKLGKIFDPRDLAGNSWMKEFAQSPSALVFDNFVRVYFCSRPTPAADGQFLSYLAFVDLDRRDLRKVLRVCDKPPLDLGECGTFDEFGTNPASVIRHGDEVRVYYAGWTRCESVPFNGALGVAISRDGGVTFARLGPGPVISYSPDEPFLMGSPRIRKFGDTWLLWYVAGKCWKRIDGKPEPIYRIRMASSANGIDWVKLGRDLITPKLGDDECQACPDVTWRDGRYHMFFSYRHPSNYKTSEGGYRIGYAISTDLAEWHRRDELAGMSVSEHGWDSEMVNYPHLFELDGKTYMLYQGNQMGRTGFGLAVLRDTTEWRMS
jgi:predicted GH43/DUF377 family glycosyl hydrolase